MISSNGIVYDEDSRDRIGALELKFWRTIYIG
jgi:hypothetical protein